MDIAGKLNDELQKQAFTEEHKLPELLNECKYIASMYARMENAIAVLSDMKAAMSYIYYGAAAEKLGIAVQNSTQTICSIWEEEVFSRIHPDDLQEKHLQELRFFHYLKGIPKHKRPNYYLVNTIRMRDNSGTYIPVRHRMFYTASHSNGSVWLALCLYNLSAEVSRNGMIVNSADGQVIEMEQHPCSDILSVREKEVLTLIDQGKASKDIARILSISLNTVNRHRQNIIGKLQAGNSIEACRTAKELNLF